MPMLIHERLSIPWKHFHFTDKKRDVDKKLSKQFGKKQQTDRHKKLTTETSSGDEERWSDTWSDTDKPRMEGAF